MTSRKFQRSMKIFGVLLLTLSSVTPASSVFVIIPGVIQQAGSGVILSLLAAGLVSLCMAFVYAELASAWPLAGGEYAMAGQALGSFAGYVLLGVNAAAYTLVPPVLALGAATYLSVIWPNAPAIPIAVGMIVLSTFSGILNIRVNAWVTGIFLAVEVIALLVVAALGFAHPVRPLADVLIHPLRAVAGAGLTATPAIAIAVSTTVAIFAFNGYGAAVYFSEEMQEAPARGSPAPSCWPCSSPWPWSLPPPWRSSWARPTSWPRFGRRTRLASSSRPWADGAWPWRSASAWPSPSSMR